MRLSQLRPLTSEPLVEHAEMTFRFRTYCNAAVEFVGIDHLHEGEPLPTLLPGDEVVLTPDLGTRIRLVYERDD